MTRVLYASSLRRRWQTHLLFEPRDLWFGVYWHRSRPAFGRKAIDVYVCLIPMFPIRITGMR